MARFHCHSCGLIRDVPDLHAGKKAKCPTCGVVCTAQAVVLEEFIEAVEEIDRARTAPVAQLQEPEGRSGRSFGADFNRGFAIGLGATLAVVLVEIVAAIIFLKAVGWPGERPQAPPPNKLRIDAVDVKD